MSDVKTHGYKARGVARAREERQAVTVQSLPMIAIGGWTLTELKPGVFWLVPPSGEGMATTQERLERLFRELWKKEF